MPMARAIGPTVTVGLHAYNGESYPAACLESILGQSLEALEPVIADDASTDRTEEICRHYAARDDRARYHRKEQRLGGRRTSTACSSWRRVGASGGRRRTT